jgi:hypothetical protein
LKTSVAQTHIKQKHKKNKIIFYNIWCPHHKPTTTNQRHEEMQKSLSRPHQQNYKNLWQGFSVIDAYAMGISGCVLCGYGADLGGGIIHSA